MSDQMTIVILLIEIGDQRSGTLTPNALAVARTLAGVLWRAAVEDPEFSINIHFPGRTLQGLAADPQVSSLYSLLIASSQIRLVAGLSGSNRIDLSKRPDDLWFQIHDYSLWAGRVLGVRPGQWEGFFYPAEFEHNLDRKITELLKTLGAGEALAMAMEMTPSAQGTRTIYATDAGHKHCRRQIMMEESDRKAREWPNRQSGFGRLRLLKLQLDDDAEQQQLFFNSLLQLLAELKNGKLRSLPLRDFKDRLMQLQLPQDHAEMTKAAAGFIELAESLQERIEQRILSVIRGRLPLHREWIDISSEGILLSPTRHEYFGSLLARYFPHQQWQAYQLLHRLRNCLYPSWSFHGGSGKDAQSACLAVFLRLAFFMLTQKSLSAAERLPVLILTQDVKQPSRIMVNIGRLLAIIDVLPGRFFFLAEFCTEQLAAESIMAWIDSHLRPGQELNDSQKAINRLQPANLTEWGMHRLAEERSGVWHPMPLRRRQLLEYGVVQNDPNGIVINVQVQELYEDQLQQQHVVKIDRMYYFGSDCIKLHCRYQTDQAQPGLAIVFVASDSGSFEKDWQLFRQPEASDKHGKNCYYRFSNEGLAEITMLLNTSKGESNG